MDKTVDTLNRETLLKQMMEMDFRATDLNLYLNTHPSDTEALKMYNEAVNKSNLIKKDYEKHFGPLTGARSTDLDSWRWMDSPWPWEKSFNFSLKENV